MERSTAVVTGGGSGIGRQAALRLLQDGWRVIALDRDEAGLASLAGEAASDALRTRVVDLTSDDAVSDFVKGVDDAAIGALVNCAGIGSGALFMEATREEFRRIYEINVVAAFALSQALVGVMERSGGGAIVNIPSVSGIRGNLGRAAYGASKGALNTLTKIMAVELADRSIRVNAVAPGPVETPLIREIHGAETRRLWGDTVPLRRYGQPEEIAEAIRFLVDPAASYITGQILAVDGGFTAAGLMSRA